MTEGTRVFVHPTAIVDAAAEIGDGTRVWHFTHVMAGAVIGRDVSIGQNGFVAAGVTVGDGSRIQNNVSLYAGVRLEDGVFIGPSVVFTNVTRPRARFPRRDQYEPTLVREGATIGANATIRSGVTIGRCAFVAAGAVVTHSVPDFHLVQGVPARTRGYVCRCGEALWFRDHAARCTACGRAYCESNGAIIEGD